jgi:deazaflavin-dependent oxidoreductase (nitroreductase family)
VAARRGAVDDASIGEQLAAWGKVALLETRGRSSGRPVTTAVGFVDDLDGALLVAAGSDASDWARNLRANPACRITIEEGTADYEATEVDGAERAAAITALILKYGTPAEGLGHGPVFRLHKRG